VALVGGVLYSIGILGASLVSSSDQLWLLVLTYGVLGGIGLGAAYITPIAMLTKWFPDKRGLITGIAVGGFGFGAVITAPVATNLLDATDDKTSVFLPLGIAYLVMVLIGASLFRNPPAGYTVPGWTPAAATATSRTSHEYTLSEALRTPQWYMLTAILTLNVLAGIAFISQASDAAQDVAAVSALTASSFVGVMGLFNGAGRILWAAASDRTGRMRAFMGMLGVQGVMLLLIPHVGVFALFAVMGALIYLCYGGGFGTMPATAADFFGTLNGGAIYGAMIVAWSIGGVVGPLIAAALYESSGGYTLPFTVLGIIALIALVLPMITRPPAPRAEARPEAVSAR
jgi:MFS transporter, OFA family, oxalate/formate antiporter